MPLSRPEDRIKTATVMRLGRILNFIKSLDETGLKSLKPEKMTSDNIFFEDRTCAGISLLNSFFHDFRIRGIEKKAVMNILHAKNYPNDLFMAIFQLQETISEQISFKSCRFLQTGSEPFNSLIYQDFLVFFVCDPMIPVFEQDNFFRVICRNNYFIGI